MIFKRSNPFWKVVGIGVLAGMRTVSAPAIASHILSSRRSRKFGKSPLAFMQSTTVATAFKLLAVGELIGDKQPSAPNRTEPLGLTARCLSGGLAGASLFKAAGRSVVAGALLGSAAAAASTYGSFYLRKTVVEQTKIFDPIVGAVEDALVLGAGVALANRA